MRGKNVPQTRLWCCQIATILVLLDATVVAEHGGEDNNC